MAKCMIRALAVKCRNSHSTSRGVGVVGEVAHARTHLPSYALGYDHNLKTGNISQYIQLNSEGLKEFVTV